MGHVAFERRWNKQLIRFLLTKGDTKNENSIYLEESSRSRFPFCTLGYPCAKEEIAGYRLKELSLS
jgi:hypothetical protein